MTHFTDFHNKNLKDALTSLKATGKDGFEGLVGLTLSAIAGFPFRLAGSGYQFGIDGCAVYEEDDICFECKRYTGDISRDVILSKIGELIRNESETELWILCATVHVKSQDASAVRELARKGGIPTLILDWSESGLPPFAVALAIGGDRVKDFLKSNLETHHYRHAVEAMTAIRKSPLFSAEKAKLKSYFDAPTVGIAIAKCANAEWLTDAFSNKIEAKIKLGQTLSPGAPHAGAVLHRKDVVNQIHQFVSRKGESNTLCIFGDEGNGKSWAVAQAWLSMERPPFMLFLTPGELVNCITQDSFRNLLVAKLILQTDDTDTQTQRNRWNKRLSYWGNEETVDSSNIIVVIDGINQRPDVDWPRVVELFGYELGKIGGKLLFTARTHYLRSHVDPCLALPLGKTEVKEWTDGQLKEILSAKGIDSTSLSSGVTKNLKNPRILGIALELYDKKVFLNFEELNPSRLLFEYIKHMSKETSNPEPPHVFAKRLRSTGQKVLDRISKKQKDDLTIFEADPTPVVDGRFFISVNGDPTRYTLNADGLKLAMAFAILDALQKAERNNHSIDDALSEIIDPVSDLDQTAEIIIAAITVASIDSNYSDEITASLICAFSETLNPNTDDYASFEAMARIRSLSFMAAAKVLLLARRHAQNDDWVKAALMSASFNKEAWQIMAKEISRWLHLHSTEPDTSFIGSTEKDKEEMRHERQQKLDEKMKKLSVAERKLLATLQENKGWLTRLHCFTFQIMAGKPLTPFTEDLVHWSFADALNSELTLEPNLQMIHLVRLNQVDWLETQRELSDKASLFQKPDISPVGHWALVQVLRSTGHQQDAQKAAKIHEGLTQGRSRLEGWRSIEKWCEVDPCDPNVKSSKLISRTAERLAETDISTFHVGRNPTREGLFWDEAKTGIARFKPESAIAKYEELVEDTVSHPDRQTYIRMRFLRDLHPLLQPRYAYDLLELYRTRCSELAEETQAFHSTNSLLLELVFPHLQGEEQIELMLDEAFGDEVLVSLFQLLKPISSDLFETLLSESQKTNDERKQSILIIFADGSETDISDNARSIIIDLLSSSSKRVRRNILRLASGRSAPHLAAAIANSAWTAEPDNNEKRDENWYGSFALLEAVRHRHLSPEAAMDRISPELYPYASTCVPSESVGMIADRLTESIKRVAENQLPKAPMITLRSSVGGSSKPGSYTLMEEGMDGMDAGLRALARSDDERLKARKQLYESFKTFQNELTYARASIILRHFEFDEFKVIVNSNPALKDNLYEYFMNLPSSRLSVVKNLVLFLAYSMSEGRPEKAVELHKLVEGINPLVSYTVGRSKIPLDCMATWAGSDHPALNEMRFSRIKQAANDHEVFLEVLAAHEQEKTHLLTTFIDEELKQGEPVNIARALMVAGFSDESEDNEALLKEHEDSLGFLGSAHAAAQYAYERNSWAKYWFKMMCSSDRPEGFWRYSVLFLKIADGRFALWKDAFPHEEIMQQYASNCENALDRRLDKWKQLRKQKLFGDRAPAHGYILANTKH